MYTVAGSFINYCCEKFRYTPNRIIYCEPNQIQQFFVKYVQQNRADILRSFTQFFGSS